jgi:hypothetical protein
MTPCALSTLGAPAHELFERREARDLIRDQHISHVLHVASGGRGGLVRAASVLARVEVRAVSNQSCGGATASKVP